MNSRFKLVGMALGAVLIIVLGGWFYYRSLHPSLPSNDQQISQLVNQLSKVIELPNEKPDLALVTDTDQLKGQAFFAKAQNGDKVLIFQQAKLALIYRPSSGKIINVGPIVVK